MKLFRLNKLAGMLLAAGALSAAAATAATPTFYMYSGDMDGARPRGMHTVTTAWDDLQLQWRDKLSYGDAQLPTAFNMESGWLRDGKLCGYMINYPSPTAEGNLYVERDLQTGEVLSQTVLDMSSDWTNYFFVATYCPADDMIYGFGLNATKTGFAFKRTPASKPNQSVIIASSKPMLNGICYNSDKGILVGVRCTRANTETSVYTPTLVEINPNTGAETKIMDLEGDAEIDYPCPMALTYVPSMKKYLWNLYSYQNVNGNLSTLVAIDAEARECETLAYYEAGYCFNYIIPTGDPGYANANVPAAPAVTSLTPGSTSTSCSVSFKMPTATAGGQSVSGSLNYTVADGSKVLKTGTADAGADVSVANLALTGNGIHYIRVVAANAAGEGVPTVQAYYVGTEAPNQVEDVTLTPTTLSWTPVTKGVYGGTLSNVKYDVYLNDTFIASTAETSYNIAAYIPASGALRAYRAKVTPKVNGLAGESKTSNKVVSGTPLTLPYTVTPTASEFDVCQMQDVDGDGVNWSAYNDSETGTPYLLSGFNNLRATEDWIFLPPVQAAKGLVTVSMQARMAQAGLKLGEISVYAGNAATKDAMTTQLLPAVRLSSDSEQTLTADLKLDQDAAPLFIGVCVRSAENALSPVTIRDINITQTATDMAVAAAPVFGEVVKEGTGRRISFTYPTKNLDGSDITADEIDVQITSVDGIVTQTGVPGIEGSFFVNTPFADNYVALTPVVEGVRGMTAVTVVKVGAGVPGMIRNLRVLPDADNTSIRLEWDAPDTNAAGEPIEGGRFNYKVWQVNAETAKYELAVEVPFPLTHANSYMGENLTLSNIQIGITAIGDEGEGAMYNELIQIGTPLTMPLDETFNGNDFAHKPFTSFAGKQYPNITYKWGNPSKLGLDSKMCQANVGDVFAAVPTAAGAKAKIWIPKFSTLGTSSAKLMLNIWTGDNSARTWVTATGYDVPDAVTVMEVPAVPGGGYQNVVVTLPPEFQDLEWVALTINSEFAALTDRMVLAGYQVGKNVSSVESVGADAARAVSVEGGIAVSNFSGVARIYNINGAKVADVAVNGSARIALANGFYLLNLNGRTVKVAVK